MLRKVRIIIATIFFIAISALFLDFTGTLHAYLGWMAKIQFLPSILALNVGIIVALVVLTLLFGRVYCSVICPMGVFQDIVSWLSGRRKGKKFRFYYSKAKNWLRYIVLALFIAAIVAGVGSFVALLEPYSAFGRIVSNLFAPVYQWCNNLVALISEKAGGYGFYSKEVWLKSLPTFIIAIVTLVVIVVLAWRGGRTYCNTICPVGSVLGLISRISLFKPSIDTEKCNNCGLCSKKCKASCIDSVAHKIDYSRCVDCMDCLETCKHGALKYRWAYGGKTCSHAACETDGTNAGGAGKGTAQISAPELSPVETRTGAVAKAARNEASEENGGLNPRRSFLTGAGLLIGGMVVSRAQNKIEGISEEIGEGGYADIVDKIRPKRNTRIVPPGAQSLKHMADHCTGCQLCVSVCPNGVLRPSGDLMTLMQPESSYERGYCRPECTKCSEVCPAGAILKIDTAEKTSIQIGHAVWIRDLCIPLQEGQRCGNCARHCPSGAITMVPSIPGDPNSIRVPVVNPEKCIGCGECEYVCPSRPMSAIYVEGHEVHRII